MGATKEQAEKTKENILKGALKTFSEKGLARARLEDIAEDIGVTRGAIYWHFQNKQELFDAVLKRTIVNTLKEAREILASDLKPMQKIRDLLVHLGIKSIEDEDYIAMVRMFTFETTSDFSEVSSKLSRRAEEVTGQQILKTVVEGIEAGEIKSLWDARIITKAIVTFIRGFSTTIRGQNKLFKKKEIPPVVDIFLEGLKR